ncbi:MAG: DNA recombination protein RmuC [Firmicutes bacterium]|nr:DNA recombination protein RmuC [Bacillota bacterium]
MSIIAVILSVTGRKRTVLEINADAEKRANALARIQEEENDLLRENLRNDIVQSHKDTTDHISTSFRNYGDLVATNQNTQAEQQDKRLAEINDTLTKYTMESELKLDNIRQAMTKQIGELTQENSKQLEQMRATVDEKLQKTLESRLGESFRLVNERLEQVYTGLGEMKSLAAGVGDLKKVLSNVKTRGILGEMQLGSILEQILIPEQYDINVITKHGSNDRVEYAVKLPGNGDEDSYVYLPIDAKFPGDTYSKLLDAYDTGDSDAVEAAAKDLERIIKLEAKDIRDKYIDPPFTTDFGILFLPVEGLYAEVVRRGMLETLQREFKINIAGPTTMAALLNSLQMGFRTLAIEKHTSEVWETLGAVKTEFDKFEGVLKQTQKNLTQAGKNLDTLIGTRTRSIKRKLRGVESLEETRTSALLGTAELLLIDEDDDDEEDYEEE